MKSFFPRDGVDIQNTEFVEREVEAGGMHSLGDLLIPTGKPFRNPETHFEFGRVRTFPWRMPDMFLGWMIACGMNHPRNLVCIPMQEFAQIQ